MREKQLWKSDILGKDVGWWPAFLHKITLIERCFPHVVCWYLVFYISSSNTSAISLLTILKKKFLKKTWHSETYQFIGDIKCNTLLQNVFDCFWKQQYCSIWILNLFDRDMKRALLFCKCIFKEYSVTTKLLQEIIICQFIIILIIIITIIIIIVINIIVIIIVIIVIIIIIIIIVMLTNITVSVFFKKIMWGRVPSKEFKRHGLLSFITLSDK